MKALALLLCLAGSVLADETPNTVTLSYDPVKQAVAITLPPNVAAIDAEFDPPEWLATESTTSGALTFNGTLPGLEAGNQNIGAGDGGAYMISGFNWLLANLEATDVNIRVETPAHYRGLVTGELLSETSTDNSYSANFRVKRQAGTVDVFFGPYEIAEKQMTLPDGDVVIRTYFKPDEQTYAEDYLAATAGYIARYSDEIGPYPFSGFSVVSAPIPVGLAFDGMTYISDQILGHPYMLGRSLAHEVLHSWWGGGVRIDYGQGNWAEGLTSYGADYALAEDRGPDTAKAMRREWLSALSSLAAEDATPLRAFKSSSHSGDQTVGYGKSAMVFHMLRQNLGEQIYSAALRHFWQANRGNSVSWPEVQSAFETVSNRDLARFFTQWLDRTELPQLLLKNVVVSEFADSHQVTVSLDQGDVAFATEVPIVIITEAGETRQVVHLENSSASFTAKVAARPLSLSIDPDFDVLRTLAPGELPPTFRDVFRAQRKAVISDNEHNAEANRLVTSLFGENDALERSPAETDVTDIDALILVGSTKEVEDIRARHFETGLPPIARDGDVRAWVEHDVKNRYWLFVSATDARRIPDALSTLRYYGNQSFFSVEPGARPSTGRWPVQNSPLQIDLQ